MCKNGLKPLPMDLMTTLILWGGRGLRPGCYVVDGGGKLETVAQALTILIGTIFKMIKT